MSIFTIISIAKEIGVQAFWPTFALALLVYAVSQFIKYASQAHTARTNKRTEQLGSVESAMALISRIESSSIPPEEMQRIKVEVLKIAGIDISEAGNVVSKPSEHSNASLSDIDVYNKFNAQAFMVSAISSIIYLPVVTICYVITGWNPSIKITGIHLVKAYSKSTIVDADVMYASSIPVFIALFIAVKLFVSRSKPGTQFNICMIFIGFFAYIAVNSSIPSEIYLP